MKKITAFYREPYNMHRAITKSMINFKLQTLLVNEINEQPNIIKYDVKNNGIDTFHTAEMLIISESEFNEITVRLFNTLQSGIESPQADEIKKVLLMLKPY